MPIESQISRKFFEFVKCTVTKIAGNNAHKRMENTQCITKRKEVRKMILRNLFFFLGNFPDNRIVL